MDKQLLIIIPLVTGFVLDTIFGDPHKLPHPIRLFGKMISFFDKNLNKGRHRKIKGALSAIILIAVTFLVFYFIEIQLKASNTGYLVFTSLFVFYGLANRSLISEALKVERKLLKDGTEPARKQLSMIVGRNTENLSEKEIRTAVLETLAENLSDGVIAPLFYYFLGGIPLMMTYKMVNTLDSMAGYKNERYKDFGFFAAKTDDLFNFIPARITALLMVLIALSRRGLMYIFRYGHKHSSPNAGYPEAALAGILNCRLGGPNIYHGKLVEKPYLGKNNREISHQDILKASVINYLTAIIFLTTGVILIYVITQ
ncbi:MAG: cobalamin biosynthesis protein CobD [Chlorobi bacterium]|nr:cobalamin biosynthesis protein CobD [Chlorobiota bacterium]